MRSLQLYGLPALSAFCLAAAFRSTGLAWLAWCGLAPFFYLLLQPQLTWKQGLQAGACFGLLFYFFLLHWLFALYPLDWLGFGRIASIFLLLLAILLIAMVKTVFLLFFTWSMAICQTESRKKRVCYLVLGWLAVEWLQGAIPGTAFTWGRIAISQYVYLPVIQSASLFGSLGLSALMACVNALLAYSWQTPWRIRWQPLVLALSLVGLNISFGYWRLAQPLPTGDAIQVGVVQSDYGSSSKHQQSTVELFQQYCSLSLQAGKVDLLVWPETAVPDLPFSYLQRIARALDTTILTGAFDERGDRVENAVFLLQPYACQKIYVKEHLVPMGEYLPCGELFRWVYPDLVCLSPGGPNQAATWNGHRLGSMICFDSTFPDISRQQARTGAELLAVVTNDSWFMDSVALSQHHGHSVFRAVETGLTVVRAANAGFSSVIDAYGRTVAALNPGKKGVLVQTVTLAPSRTLYVQLGDLLPIGATILFCTGTICNLLHIIRRRRGWHGNQN